MYNMYNMYTHTHTHTHTYIYTSMHPGSLHFGRKRLCSQMLEPPHSVPVLCKRSDPLCSHQHTCLILCSHQHTCISVSSSSLSIHCLLFLSLSLSLPLSLSTSIIVSPSLSPPPPSPILLVKSLSTSIIHKLL